MFLLSGILICHAVGWYIELIYIQTELHKKALKAYYKLHKDLLNLNPNINNCNLTIQLNLSYYMDVKYGGVLIQLQQDLEMEQ